MTRVDYADPATRNQQISMQALHQVMWDATAAPPCAALSVSLKLVKPTKYLGVIAYRGILSHLNGAVHVYTDVAATHIEKQGE